MEKFRNGYTERAANPLDMENSGQAPQTSVGIVPVKPTTLSEMESNEEYLQRRLNEEKCRASNYRIIILLLLVILGLTLYLALGFLGLALLAALIGLYFLFDRAGKTL